jgi:hypothetical protein
VASIARASIADSRDQIWGGFDRGSSGPDLGWLRSLVVGSRSGVASIAGRLRSQGGFDLGRVLESHRAALNHELTDLINRLIGFGSGAAERERAEKESREREQKKSREGDQRGESRTRVLGKWFTENFSVNRFHFFCEGFSGQTEKIFS